MSLENLRSKIDKVDEKIINLLWIRFSCVKEVAMFKKVNNINAFQSKRWKEVLEKRKYQGKANSLDEEMIIEIWETIHKFALKLENEIINN